jgi:hypothetical protein
MYDKCKTYYVHMLYRSHMHTDLHHMQAHIYMLTYKQFPYPTSIQMKDYLNPVVVSTVLSRFCFENSMVLSLSWGNNSFPQQHSAIPHKKIMTFNMHTSHTHTHFHKETETCLLFLIHNTVSYINILAIEDEIHMLLTCPLYINLRKRYGFEFKDTSTERLYMYSHQRTNVCNLD